jgi:hypothetical protein
MSQQVIRGALQAQLATLGWEDQTAWPKRHFEPTSGVPYQRVDCLFAEPNSYGLGEGALERGIFQVTLAYPLNSGAAEPTARAEAIRAAFPKNSRPGGVVKITRKPEITELGEEGDRSLTSVRIRFTER